MLNHILADLATSSTSGHTAAGVLDRWRSITLGGDWAGGGLAAGIEGADAAAVTAEIVQYSRPTEVRLTFPLLLLMMTVRRRTRTRKSMC